MKATTKSTVICAAGFILAALFLLSPSPAEATQPCEPDEPCHNNFAEPGYMFGFGSDAFLAGIITTTGNAVALGRGRPANLGWIVTGYLASSYNLILGITWISKAGPDLREFPDDDYAWMMLGVGLANFVMGSLTLSVTAAAHSNRRTAIKAGGVSLIPAVTAMPGGAGLMIAGRFFIPRPG